LNTDQEMLEPDVSAAVAEAARDTTSKAASGSAVVFIKASSLDPVGGDNRPGDGEPSPGFCLVQAVWPLN
jgi:hypothetical protein